MMGNPEHLEWLLEGVEAWNARRERTGFTPDFRNTDLIAEIPDWAYKFLSGVNLTRADFSHANFSGANLSDCLLTDADLTGSIFEASNLKGADLRKANLSLARLSDASLAGAVLDDALLDGANLEEADFRRAVLDGASLVGANLSRADFEGASLRGTSLEGANLEGAVFWKAALTEADFSKAILLRTDFRTVYSGAGSGMLQTARYSELRLTKGLTQEAINEAIGDRGVMLPEGLEYPQLWPVPPHLEDSEPPQDDDGKIHFNMPSESPTEAQEAFVFLSYSRDDTPRAGALRDTLNSAGLPIWWDQDMTGGDRWRDEIAGRLKSASAVFTLWTEGAVASDAVREEASTAQANGILVHARLDDAALPYGFGETQWIDLRAWDGTESDPNLRRLVQALRDKLDPPSEAEKAARLRAGAPVEAKVHAGRLKLYDTPVNTPPLRDEPVEKAERIRGLWQSVARVEGVIREDHQIPPRMKTEVAAFAALQEHDELSWFALEDGADGLASVMQEYGDLKDGLPSLFDGVSRIVTRARELEEFMRPAQPEPDAPNAKPVQTEPRVTPDQLPEVWREMPDLEEALESEAAAEVLDADTLRYLQDAVRDTEEAAKDGLGIAEDARFRRVRSGVKKLVYGLGAITTAISGGVMANLLTAQDAAVALAARLQQVVTWLLKFF